ncbi:MAG: hypothetical protein JXD22_02905 [Sedimentisphaerales bacterium]|nr:hypothetical protein [Sedimentisphaerales bacterium]
MAAPKRTSTQINRSARDLTITVHQGPIEWSCLSGYHLHLTGSEAPNWLDLDHDPKAELVKANPLRRVYRLKIKDLQFYAKIYQPNSWLGRLKWFCQPSPSQNEFQNLQIARNRSVTAAKPVAFASGKLKHRPFAILLTESIGPCVSLEELIWQELAPKDKQRDKQIDDALDASAKLLALLHCGGIIHRDLHPGNILLVGTQLFDSQRISSQLDNPQPGNSHADSAQPKTIAYITDLQNAAIEQRGGHASADPHKAARIKNLAMLMSGMRYNVLQDKHLKFVSAYLRAMQPHRKISDADLKSYFQKVSSLTDLQDWRIWASRDRRCLRNSRYSKKISLPNNFSARVFCQIKHPPPDSAAAKLVFEPNHWRQALTDPLSLTEFPLQSYYETNGKTPGGGGKTDGGKTDGGESDGGETGGGNVQTRAGSVRLLKKGNHNTVITKPLKINNLSINVVVKHSIHRAGIKGFWQSVRRSRAMRQWQRAHALLNRDIPTAFPLAALEQRKWLLLRQSILLCEEIPDCQNLHQMISRNTLPKSRYQRTGLIIQMAQLLTRLRERNLRHRDCKSTNIVIRRLTDRSKSSEKSGFQLYLVDLDGLRPFLIPARLIRIIQKITPHFPGHEAFLRLAGSVLACKSPNITRTDLMRFFLAYYYSLCADQSHKQLSKKVLWRKLSAQLQKKYPGVTLGEDSETDNFSKKPNPSEEIN